VLVFCREDGSFLRPDEFTKRFQRLLKKAGLPKVRLHDLRHTHASLLLARGVHPKVVQERLGHSSITMTLDLYSHLTPGLQEAAAATLNGLLNQRKSPAKTQGDK
jgi:integrase